MTEDVPTTRDDLVARLRRAGELLRSWNERLYDIRLHTLVRWW
jgi:hypothetical protein